VKLFILGLRRSGTTILFDALGEDEALRCYYEPLREEDATEGGGSGARSGDAFAETRAWRERYRDSHYPELPLDQFNWGGPRDAELELEPWLPEHVRGFLAHLLTSAEDVAIKETRLHHKLGALAELAPDARLVHLVRDPRAVSASMLLGRRRRLDLYPDADAFFTVRTRRKLWSSRPISAVLLGRRRSLGLPPDLPDFLRPLLVWTAAFEAAHGDGRRLFGDRYTLLRLEDLRSAPAEALGRVYGLTGRPLPPEVERWAAAHLRRDEELQFSEDPRWARAARRLGMEDALAAAGYAEVLELESADGPALELDPPPPPSRLSAAIGRASRRFGRP
jgi:hypothetical protein